MALWCHMVPWKWLNLAPGNGLVPDGTKPSPEPMLTYHFVRTSDTFLREIALEIPQPAVTKIRFKIDDLKFYLNLWGANELTPWGRVAHIYASISYTIIKSPQYTGGDFMFLYRFVRRSRRRPQILVHAITFEQLFGFLSFLAQLLALTCR